MLLHITCKFEVLCYTTAWNSPQQMHNTTVPLCFKKLNNPYFWDVFKDFPSSVEMKLPEVELHRHGRSKSMKDGPAHGEFGIFIMKNLQHKPNLFNRSCLTIIRQVKMKVQ